MSLDRLTWLCSPDLTLVAEPLFLAYRMGPAAISPSKGVINFSELRTQALAHSVHAVGMLWPVDAIPL